MKKNIRGFPDSDQSDRYAQIILKRLMFLWFLQTRGFLDNDFNYLISNFIKNKDNNYFKEFLSLLFFEGLSKAFNDRKKSINGLLGKIPYLNIDIFLPAKEELIYRETIEISNSVFYKEMDYPLNRSITSLPVLNLLESTSWTINEKIGDVSRLKPNILSYILERSLDQKAAGAIYTPNQITSKMCKTTLIEYINKTLNLNYSTFNSVLKENDEKKQSQILNLITSIKILDPAVGSGDFLVKMLFLLEDIYSRFANTDNKLLKEKHEINGENIRKFIIRNNLFGVDISPEAIETCQMRLILAVIAKVTSLEEINQLPDIYFYYRCGDSLLGIYERSSRPVMDFRDNPIVRIKKERMQQNRKNEQKIGYQTVNAGERINKKSRELNDVFTQMLLEKPEFRDIYEKYTPRQFHEKFHPFHWTLEFPEILQATDGGFDIIIGNPPYVRADYQDLVYQEYRRIIERNFSLLTQKWDLFIPFLELGIKLLKPNGIMSFIISDGFSTSNYASKMRKYLLTKELFEICFFSGIQIFETMNVSNIIVSLRNRNRNVDHITKRVFYKNLGEVEKIEKVKIEDYGERLFRKKYYSMVNVRKFAAETIPLGRIFYISVGMVLNSDEKRFKGKFKKNDLIRDKRGRFFNKKYIENKYIDKFRINDVKFLEYGTDRVPRQIRRPTFPELYDSPKIMVGAIGGRGIYDECGSLWCNHSIMILKPYHDLVGIKTRVLNRRAVKEAILRGKPLSLDFDLRYILGIINSSFANSYLNSIRTHRQENYFQPNDLRKLPIPNVDKKNQIIIKEIVEKIERNRTLHINKSNHDVKNELEAQFQQLLMELDDQINDLYFNQNSPTGE
ncbi:MAG: Eco57I restriction-modification methylase domain-containing protein [Candidatus Thorarchaeota archaeon]